MNASSKRVDAVAVTSGATGRQRMIHPCDFRYAGRLSNENARVLSALHERFAVSVSNALELYLGASLRVRMVFLEQMAIADYISGIAPSNYLLPYSLDLMDANCLIDMDVALILPVIDLLLGGSGDPGEQIHELTEIDEEIMKSVSVLIAKELERTWKSLNLTLTPGHCVKPAMIQQIFPVNEKLVLLMFEMTVGSTNGTFTIALPTPFVGFLLRHLKQSQSKKMASMRLQRPSLRERMLDCEFQLSAEVVQMRMQLKDLLDLKPGAVLRAKSPVKEPAKLTVEGVEVFEALPVRSGRFKAAQIVARTQETTPAKD
ncbi:MAG: flagellar motor switch protein FliM [Acidobacteriota bacterium]